MVTEAIINKIENVRDKIVRVYFSVPVTEILEPTLSTGQSVKDLIAHIAAWEWHCAELLAESHDSDALLLAKPDVVALNDEIHQERQEWSWEDVETDFRLAHQQLLRTIKRLPTERLSSRSIQGIIAKSTWEHYEIYLPDLQRWHKQAVYHSSNNKK